MVHGVLISYFHGTAAVFILLGSLVLQSFTFIKLCIFISINMSNICQIII